MTTARVSAPKRVRGDHLSVENRLPIDWDGRGQVTKPTRGTLLAERSVALGPDGGARLDRLAAIVGS